MSSDDIEKAAQLIQWADSILIAVGAGMGVDSGLPDFRGNAGFWNAYPALKAKEMSFSDIASPESFEQMPDTAWGFYGHRLNLYRNTTPHIGFNILKAISKGKSNGYFVFTSNVDGQFQKAGFDDQRILEKHGSIHHLQCTLPCIPTVWSAEDIHVDIDEEQCKIESLSPRCPYCSAMARPNILMFSDFDWVEERYVIQNNRYQKWRKQADNLVVIEIGAGTVIPSVRREAEYSGAPIIRINPLNSGLNGCNGVALEMGAKEALMLIVEQMTQS